MHIMEGFLPPAHARYFVSQGFDLERYQRIIEPVSPLAVKPKLKRERLHILAATGDRLTVPRHPLALSQHWDVPVTWYQGSHLSIRREHATHELLRNAVAGAGWNVE